MDLMYTDESRRKIIDKMIELNGGGKISRELRYELDQSLCNYGDGLRIFGILGMVRKVKEELSQKVLKQEGVDNDMDNELHPITNEIMQLFIKEVGEHDMAKDLPVDADWYLNLGNKVEKIVQEHIGGMK